jgi:hypothetical protein
VSHEVIDSIKDMCILDDGDNVSDHKPIKFNLDLTFDHATNLPQSKPVTHSLKWNKCSDEQKQNYTAALVKLICSKSAPEGLHLCGKHDISKKKC